jgi:hypothetical protein
MLAILNNASGQLLLLEDIYSWSNSQAMGATCQC